MFLVYLTNVFNRKPGSLTTHKIYIGSHRFWPPWLFILNSLDDAVKPMSSVTKILFNTHSFI